MTHALARFGTKLLLLAGAIPAIAAQTEPPPPPPSATFNIFQHGATPTEQPAQGEQGGPVQNKLMFVTGDQANDFARQYQERLADPVKRAALRAEQRETVASANASVGRVVGLDPDTVEKLIDLLVDQNLERSERMYSQPRSNFADLQMHADEATRRMDALSELLGEEKLERFQIFEMSQSARGWVIRFAEQLAPADKLQPEQEDRLTAFKQQQFDSFSENAISPWRTLRGYSSKSLSVDDWQKDSQRQTRILNENAWRKRQVENRVLEQTAATFLTTTQLAELSKYLAQEQDNLRNYVESARASAGLNPKIPDQPESVEEAPKPIEADVQVEVNLTVNREPTTVTRTVHTGESFTFEAAPGLIVEATPTMYDPEWVDIHLKYYEQGSTGRRRLSGGSIATAQARPSGPAMSGAGGTVISGRKGYAVESRVTAKVL